jgi:hypothetical protein
VQASSSSAHSLIHPYLHPWVHRTINDLLSKEDNHVNVPQDNFHERILLQDSVLLFLEGRGTIHEETFFCLSSSFGAPCQSEHHSNAFNNAHNLFPIFLVLTVPTWLPLEICLYHGTWSFCMVVIIHCVESFYFITLFSAGAGIPWLRSWCNVG